jgi:hypothetical protein
VARPRETVGCSTLICRKADSGQLNDFADFTAKWVEPSAFARIYFAF